MDHGTRLRRENKMEIGKRYFIQKNDIKYLYKYNRWEYQGETELGHLFTCLNVDYIIPNDEIDQFVIIEDNYKEIYYE